MNRSDVVEFFAAHAKWLADSWGMSPEGREYKAKFDAAVVALNDEKELIASAQKDAIWTLMVENGNMKALLLELLPDMESRVAVLREAWPGRDVLTALRRNETHVRKIREFTAGFDLPYNA